MPNWWQVHTRLLEGKGGLGETDPRRERFEGLLYEHISPKVRIEQSKWFTDVVKSLRLEQNVVAAVRRYFEAFVFLCRSALDCEAYFINDLCGVGLTEGHVNFVRLKEVLKQRPDLATLLAVLEQDTSASPCSWFWHFSKLRNSATHRTVSGSAIVLCVGGVPEYRRHDRYFVLANPEDRMSFGKDAKFGVGAYTDGVLAKTFDVIESAEGVLAEYLESGVIAP
jgi:hypothetical protein